MTTYDEIVEILNNIFMGFGVIALLIIVILSIGHHYTINQAVTNSTCELPFEGEPCYFVAGVVSIFGYLLVICVAIAVLIFFYAIGSKIRS